MGTQDFTIRVDLKEKRPFITSLASDLKEVFFPDDPFRRLKDQSAKRRVWSLLQYYVPILEWGPKYTLAKFRYDLLAGITIASLAIPQGISYARLADLPPIIGLYSSFVPPIIYAIFGSSKNLAVGTVAAASLLMASMIGSEVSPIDDTELYVRLFYTAAFVTRVFQTAMGIFRLGMLVDFLSRSTITGFMGGTMILIILQQLKGMLGMKRFTQHTDVISVLHAVFMYNGDWRWQSAVLGIIFLGILLYTRHLERVGSANVDAMLSGYAPVFYGDIRSHERVNLPFTSFIFSCKLYIQNASVKISSSVGKDDSLPSQANSDELCSTSLDNPDQLYLTQAPILSTESKERPPLEVLSNDILTV